MKNTALYYHKAQ